MDQDLECGVCFKSYNGGRRCPRELTCKHTFCESCLVTISRAQSLTRTQSEQGVVVTLRYITCPLCRHVTSLSGHKRKIRDGLQANECVLERLRAEGILDQEGDDEPEEAEDKSCRGTLRRAWKKVLRKITIAESEGVPIGEDPFSKLSPWFYMI